MNQMEEMEEEDGKQLHLRGVTSTNHPLVTSTRGLELDTVVLVDCSLDVIESIAGSMEDWLSVTTFKVMANRAAPLLEFTETLANARFNSRMDCIVLELFTFSTSVMETWCQRLLTRERPITTLQLGDNRYEDEALLILLEAIPHLNLKRLTIDLTDIKEQQFTRLTKMLGKSRTLENITLILYGFSLQSKEHLEQLGSALSNCVRLKGFRLNCSRVTVSFEPFVRACGYHPQLSVMYIRELNAGLKSNGISKHVQRLRTKRAKCVTALVCGAVVERVGKHSNVWRIPLDVFRRLCDFLPT